MPPVVRTALDLLRRPAGWLPVAVVALGGSALIELPLFGLPGLELGLAVSFCSSPCLEDGPGPAPPTRCGRCRAQRAARSATGAGRSRRPVGWGPPRLLLVAAAAVPFSARCFAPPLGTRCGPFAQAGFYPLLVIPAAVLAAACGLFCRTAFAARLPGRSASTSFSVLASVAWTAWPLIRGPQVDAWNFFLGYFPGPLYDEALPLPTALWWFRLETLLWAGLFAGCAAGVFPAPGPAHRRHRIGIVLFLALVAAPILAMESSTRWPSACRSTDASVRAALGGRAETAHAELIFPARSRPRRWSGSGGTWRFRLFQLGRFFGAPPPPVRALPLPLRGGEAAAGGRREAAVRQALAAERLPQRCAASLIPRSSTSWRTWQPGRSGSGPFQVTSASGWCR